MRDEYEWVRRPCTEKAAGKGMFIMGEFCMGNVLIELNVSIPPP